MHSTQPVPLGLAAGLIPSLSDFMGTSDFCLLQLRIDAVFASELTCRYRAAAQVVARLTLGEPSRGRHGGFVFVS